MSLFTERQLDPAIVARARRGDRKAQEILYRTYDRAVYTTALRVLRRPELAEDVLQDTFVEVIRHITSYRGEAPVSAWIRSIAVNKCLMYLRSAWYRYSRSLEFEHDDRGSDDCGPAAQARVDLEAALAMLTPVSRAVVWLYDVEGYTHREIGELMGKTTSFSKSQLARAHTRLRGLLDVRDEKETCTPVSKSS